MKERLNEREDQMKRSDLLLIGLPEAENRELGKGNIQHYCD